MLVRGLTEGMHQVKNLIFLMRSKLPSHSLTLCSNSKVQEQPLAPLLAVQLFWQWVTASTLGPGHRSLCPTPGD